jgi:hypothetical protein
MLPGHAAKSTLGLVIGLAAFYPLTLIPAVPNQLLYLRIGFVLVLLCCLWGLSNLSRGKGYSGFWALPPLIPLIVKLRLWDWLDQTGWGGFDELWRWIAVIPLGAGVLLALPDHLEKRKRPAFTGRFEKPPRKSLAVPLILLAVTGLIAGGWCLYYFGGKSGWKTPSPAEISPQQATQQALKAYPELAIKDSALNREFVTRYNRYQATNKDYFNDPDWPTKLAAESQAALQSPPPRR